MPLHFLGNSLCVADFIVLDLITFIESFKELCFYRDASSDCIDTFAIVTATDAIIFKLINCNRWLNQILQCAPSDLRSQEPGCLSIIFLSIFDSFSNWHISVQKFQVKRLIFSSSSGEIDSKVYMASCMLVYSDSAKNQFFPRALTTGPFIAFFAVFRKFFEQISGNRCHAV